ncbi:MAG: hypothetical protein RL238_3672 [Actinomycetota bacterium]|jgi:hypothetical protein
MSTPDRPTLRRILLGLEGPYADPRVATDALDNLAELTGGLSTAERTTLAGDLAALVHDPDAIVATGAVLGLRQVAGELDAVSVQQVVADLARPASEATGLDRRPVGFSAADRSTLRETLALVAMPVIALTDAMAARRLLDTPPHGVTRSDLAMAAAPHVPDLLLEHASEWCTPENTGVLLRLPSHWHRIAMAGAIAPWSTAAHAVVDQVAGWQQWAEGDTDALHRAMTGDDPHLNRPEGIDELDGDDHGRWRIIAGTPYGWTLWRADDGTMAREVLDDGPAWTSTTRLLTADEVAAVTVHGASVAAEW